jgi:hypothetical protein
MIKGLQYVYICVCVYSHYKCSEGGNITVNFVSVGATFGIGYSSFVAVTRLFAE